MNILGWGFFCACSWTWCIGMFLPLIMIDRWGWAGFAAFAAPNVIGCTAFGYVLRNAERSQRMVREHRTAMRAFSVVTLAYHVFFIGFVSWWVFAPELYWEGVRLAIVAPIALLAVSALMARLPAGVWLPFAGLVYVFSLVVFAIVGVDSLFELSAVRGELTAFNRGLLWIVPALAFGFLLCPYLDLTFHRALAQSRSRASFAVFGAAFTVMILLSAAYADAFSAGLSWVVLAHLTAQTIFTMAAHQRELLVTSGTAPKEGGRMGVSLLPLLALPLVFAALAQDPPLDGSIDMYLRFLVFYGLLFPGYVLLRIGCGARSGETAARRRGSAWLLWILALVAAVVYEAAFIHDYAVLAIAPPAAMILWCLLRAARRGPT